MSTTAVVIDDDIDTQEVFTEYLDMNEFEVLARGNNGREALELYKKHKPEILFLDVMMPQYDGIYGLEKVREYDPKAKIVVVTASITSSTQKKLLDLNVNAIIWKPYDMNYLLSTVERVKKGESKILPRTNA